MSIAQLIGLGYNSKFSRKSVQFFLFLDSDSSQVKKLQSNAVWTFWDKRGQQPESLYRGVCLLCLRQTWTSRVWEGTADCKTIIYMYYHKGVKQEKIIYHQLPCKIWVGSKLMIVHDSARWWSSDSILVYR